MLSRSAGRPACVYSSSCTQEEWVSDRILAFYSFFLSIFYWLCYYSCPTYFLPFIPLHPAPPSPAFPSFSSCPWVIHISFFDFPLPILFLTFPCLFYAYQLYFLFPMPFYSILPPSPLPFPDDNPPSNHHCCDSVFILIIFCLFLFLFF